MSATRIAEIRARLAAATPGPWDVGERDGGMGWDVFQVNGDDLPQPRLRGMFGHQPDAEFIAHAPADLQWCLARIAALETAARHVPRPRETDLMLGDDEWWWRLQMAIAEMA